MGFFDVRRVRVRHEHAHLYPEVTSGVWLSARQVTRLVRKGGARRPCQLYHCARGRVLCDLHFEFRGGSRGSQFLTGEWSVRLTPTRAMAIDGSDSPPILS